MQMIASKKVHDWNGERLQSRSKTGIRTISCTYGEYSNAHGSVIFGFGGTKVLCAVTLQPGVPSFLKGTGSGWLTAEYALLPTSTNPRITRELIGCKRNGRSVEISRLIGRVLRTVVDLSALGERTLHIDCDVLQADGGTRVASITGASMALFQAQTYALSHGLVKLPFIKEGVAAISVGIKDGEPFVDPTSQEDSHMDADFNFIITQSKKLVEIQGGSEKVPISWSTFDRMRSMAIDAIDELFQVNSSNMLSHEIKECDTNLVKKNKTEQKQPIFSLFNR